MSSLDISEPELPPDSPGSSVSTRLLVSNLFKSNRIGGVMVSVFALSEVDHGFEA